MRRTAHIKPMSNFHRLLTMLALNGGTLSPAQFYAARGSKKDNYPFIELGVHSRKMSMVSPFAPLHHHYEHRAESMGLVSIQRLNNRKWVTILPKGHAVLALLDRGETWDLTDSMLKGAKVIR